VNEDKEEFWQKVKSLSEAAKKTIKKETTDNITQEEDIRLDYWVMDMMKHIEKRAKTGKTTFSYDCSKIRRELFEELALRFVQKNPRIMVIKDGGRQYLNVDWSGKNEC
jgi:hypothetical protein